MNYSLLVPCWCCYLDRQEKIFFLICHVLRILNYTLYWRIYKGQKKNGNSLNEMKILAAFFLKFFLTNNDFFGWTDVSSKPNQPYHNKNSKFCNSISMAAIVSKTLLLRSTCQMCKILQKSMMWYIFNAQFHFTCM